MRKQKSPHICLWLALVLALTLAPAPAPAADNKYWVGPAGEQSWWNNLYWSYAPPPSIPGAGPPGQDDGALITQNDGISRTVLYNPPPGVTFQQVIGNITVDTPYSQTIYNAIKQDSSYFPLYSREMYVGFWGAGGFYQYSGLNNIKDNFYLGFAQGSLGRYELCGGILQAPHQEIGVGGQGVFIQNGGENQVGKQLFISSTNLGGSGTYTLQGSGKLKVQKVEGEVLNGEFVGIAGTGEFKQYGNTTNETPMLVLGLAGGSKGYYELGGGTLTTTLGTALGIRELGICEGEFWQYGGNHNTIGLGVMEGTYKLSGGNLTAQFEVISSAAGESISKAHFQHTGGVNSVDGLAIGTETYGGPGDYTLSESGWLIAKTCYVGHAQAGTFDHQGGTHDSTLSLVLGYTATGKGTYNLVSGDLTAGSEIIGKDGEGHFTQNGGKNVTGLLQIGSKGVYDLAGGMLHLAAMDIKPGGQFNKTGSDFQAGSVTNAGNMILGGSGPSVVSGRTDNLPGGLIHINRNPASFGGEVVNQGTFKVTETSVTFAGPYTEKGVFISQGGDQIFTSLRVEAEGYLIGGANSRWLFSQDLEIRSTRSFEWDTSAAELAFISGGPPNPEVLPPTYHLLTVPGQDLGATAAGFQKNFAWGRLVLNNQQFVFLQDGDETPGGALYVRQIAGLLFDEGNHWITNLFSNGLNLYYDPLAPGNEYLAGQRFSLAGAGYLGPVPLPATWLLLGSGLLGLMGLRRFRKT